MSVFTQTALVLCGLALVALAIRANFVLNDVLSAVEGQKKPTNDPRWRDF